MLFENIIKFVFWKYSQICFFGFLVAFICDGGAGEGAGVIGGGGAGEDAGGARRRGGSGKGDLERGDSDRDGGGVEIECPHEFKKCQWNLKIFMISKSAHEIQSRNEDYDLNTIDLS